MIARNTVFDYQGKSYRLLHQEGRKAWAIQVDSDEAWPVEFDWHEVSKLDSVVLSATASNAWVAPTFAMTSVRDKAHELIKELLAEKNLPAIFDSKIRGGLIGDHSLRTGVSRKTIYKHLRRYWQGGQTPTSLLATYHACGRSSSSTRGGHTPRAGHTIYVLKEDDHLKMKDVIEKHYLKGDTAKISTTYALLARAHYQIQDGNGTMFIAPAGERPSRRQFEHFLRKNYSLEVRLRSRKGDKNFERNFRGVLGTVDADCRGVGHYYEVDASIADVFLVARESIHVIVGKPTIYLIIDRKSRLIVGWYVGLENPSWMCAMLAFRSISEDKQAICERYGVPYSERDWPAHKIFPHAVLADRGEVATYASSALTTELGVEVVNVTAQRPDWKPVVECGFKQMRSILQDGTPGFDPPENAKARQAIKNEKDACLTLDDFRKVFLTAVIRHNNRAISNYELDVSELTNKVLPIPIDLWNHDIANRIGNLDTHEEEKVRFALLPRGKAMVTKNGIIFERCSYACREALDRGWFISSRQERFPVEVIYEPGLVDTIYVRDPNRKGELYKCTLTDRSRKFAGCSFPEVKTLLKQRKDMDADIEQNRLQMDARYHSVVDPVHKEKKGKLKDAGYKARTARKAAIKDNRNDELRTERQESSALTQSSPVQGAKVISLANAGRNRVPKVADSVPSPVQSPQAPAGTPAPIPKERSLAELARSAAERLKRGF